MDALWSILRVFPIFQINITVKDFLMLISSMLKVYGRQKKDAEGPHINSRWTTHFWRGLTGMQVTIQGYQV